MKKYFSFFLTVWCHSEAKPKNLSPLWRGMKGVQIVLLFQRSWRAVARLRIFLFGRSAPNPGLLFPPSWKSNQKSLLAHFGISNNTSLRSVLAKFEAEPNDSYNEFFWALIELADFCFEQTHHRKRSPSLFREVIFLPLIRGDGWKPEGFAVFFFYW